MAAAATEIVSTMEISSPPLESPPPPYAQAVGGPAVSLFDVMMSNAPPPAEKPVSPVNPSRFQPAQPPAAAAATAAAMIAAALPLKRPPPSVPALLALKQPHPPPPATAASLPIKQSLPSPVSPRPLKAPLDEKKHLSNDDIDETTLQTVGPQPLTPPPSYTGCSDDTPPPISQPSAPPREIFFSQNGKMVTAKVPGRPRPLLVLRTSTGGNSLRRPTRRDIGNNSSTRLYAHRGGPSGPKIAHAEFPQVLPSRARTSFRENGAVTRTLDEREEYESATGLGRMVWQKSPDAVQSESVVRLVAGGGSRDATTGGGGGGGGGGGERTGDMLARFETFGSTGQDGQGFKELGRMAAETNNNLRQHHHQQQQQQKKFGHHQHHPDPHQSFRSLLAPGHMPYAKMDIYADALTDEQLEEVVFSCFVQRQRTRTAESVARATAEAAAEVAAAGGSVASAA